ncbi:MAG: SOS response-associated peptidase, partial [Chloroflexi bacterium]|nr:SOS response-associated peptidase [Chloroflexota bacterium]
AMCGRYSLTSDLDTLQLRFGFRAGDLTYEPRYNVAPTQEVLTVTGDGSENQNHARFMRWGLIPFWAKDASIGGRMINARAETVVEKPGYREAFQERRCLILADGFYEWRREGKLRTPMRIVLKNGDPFGFAGIWETWKNPEGELVRSCAIITTVPNALMEPIHNRMPVMLARDTEELWLDTGNKDTAELRELLIPYDPSDMEAYPVSDLVNKYQNDVPEVMVRV